MIMSNTIIRASAGSGKTYQLSNRFLQLLFDAPSIDDVVDRILASTFTRKAAGEISDRILTKLADIALDKPKRDALGKDLCYPQTAKIEEELQRRLADLARNLYRMRVGTLDSYYNKIASVFSLELELPPGWTILEDSDFERLIDEAAREVFEDSARNKAKDLMYLLQQGQEESSITKDLARLAKDWLPLARSTQTTPDVWNHDLPEKLKDLTTGMLDDAAVEVQLKRLENLDEDDLPKTKTKPIKPVQDFVAIHSRLIEHIRNKNWDVFLEETLVQKVLATLTDDAADCIYSRSKINVRLDAPIIFDVVRTLTRHAQGLQIRILIDQTAATRDLLNLVAEKLDTIMIRERKFRFEDITRKVSSFDFGGKQDSLDHRLNAETEHLLLDEFQDTSKPQWDVLEPLARQVAKDEDGTFFCVGDVKQAIYSWRGGVAAIFDTMESKLKKEGIDIVSLSMDATRRNVQPIIDTVNFLFGGIDPQGNLVQDGGIQRNTAVVAASQAAGIAWKKRFNEHKTFNTATGYCVLEESLYEPDPEIVAQGRAAVNAAKEQAHLDYVVDRIAELAAILNKRPSLEKGLGVLVGTNDMAGQIVGELKKRGIEASGGGGSLADSLAVRYVLSAMVLADHPGDGTATFHLANGPLAELLGLPKFDDKFKALESSRQLRQDLADHGYGEVVMKFLEILAPFCDPREFQRLEKLLELAYRFDEEASGIRTEAFVSRVKAESAASPNATNIHVMTVHGSKGLEFDFVVLPELDRSFIGTTPNIVVGHEIPEDPTTPINLVLRYVSQSLQPLLPESYQKIFERRIQGEVEESLSELYVALTRAVRQLVMIVPPRDPDYSGKTYEGVLRTGLPKNRQGSSPTNVLFETGDSNWFATIPSTESSAPIEEICELDCRLADRKVFRHVPRIVPSHLHKAVAKPSESSGKTATPARTREESLLWGTAIHACFEHGVVWLDEKSGQLDDQSLHRIVEEILRGRTLSFTAQDVVTKFHESCRKPEIAKILSRSRYSAPKVELERERRFAVWSGDKILHGSIDRLVVQRNAAGTITEIEILDYKSDQGDDVASLVEAYRDQMDAYRKGIASLYRIGIEKIAATLVLVTIGQGADV